MNSPIRNPQSAIPNPQSPIRNPQSGTPQSAIRIPQSAIEEAELSKLLNGIERRYGYDFRNYARASLKRRVLRCVQDEQVGSISALRERLLGRRGDN
jgi:hypothetical protein